MGPSMDLTEHLLANADSAIIEASKGLSCSYLAVSSTYNISAFRPLRNSQITRLINLSPKLTDKPCAISSLFSVLHLLELHNLHTVSELTSFLPPHP